MTYHCALSTPINQNGASKMTNNITLTIPSDDANAIKAAKAFFEALDTSSPEAFAEDVKAIIEEEVTHPADAFVQELEAVEAPAPVIEETEAPAPAIDVDCTGLPWDARIHAGTKTKTAKGEWKKKRGVDPILVKQVEAELTELMAVPTPVQEETPPTPVEHAPAADTPPPAPVSAAITFPQLMGKITSTQTPQETIDAALAQTGVASLPLLAARPDLVATVYGILFGGE